MKAKRQLQLKIKPIAQPPRPGQAEDLDLKSSAQHTRTGVVAVVVVVIKVSALGFRVYGVS